LRLGLEHRVEEWVLMRIDALVVQRLVEPLLLRNMLALIVCIASESSHSFKVGFVDLVNIVSSLIRALLNVN